MTSNSQGPKSSKDEVADDAGKQTTEDPAKEGDRNGQEKDVRDQEEALRKEEFERLVKGRPLTLTTLTDLILMFTPVSAARFSYNNLGGSIHVTGIFSGTYDDDDVGAEADLKNLETTMNVSPFPTTRIHKDHPKDEIIGDINSATQTRRMTKISEEHAMVWRLVDLPKGKHAIGTKWVYRNKKDERGIVVRNKARLVTQGYMPKKKELIMMRFLLLLLR
ncbi:putative ribonuclease H-like domain-containing protein [Tanacetum coccineum]